MDKGWTFAILGALIVLGSIGAYTYGTYKAEAYTSVTERDYYGEPITENYNPSEHAKGEALKRGAYLGFIFGGVIAAFGWYLIHIDKMLEKERIKIKSDEPKD